MKDKYRLLYAQRGQHPFYTFERISFNTWDGKPRFEGWVSVLVADFWDTP